MEQVLMGAVVTQLNYHLAIFYRDLGNPRKISGESIWSLGFLTRISRIKDFCSYTNRLVGNA
jgi:hypothetical protein